MRVFRSTIAAAAAVVLYAGPMAPSAFAQPPIKGSLACDTCVSVLDTIKRGVSTVSPSMCTPLKIDKGPEAVASCEQVLSDLARVKDFRAWIVDGCYESHGDGSKEWIRPCPTRLQCTTLKQKDGKAFCPETTIPKPER